MAAERALSIRNDARSRGSIRQGPHLVFNFLPVSYRPGKFTAYEVDFRDAEQLDELRMTLSGSHVVFRRGASIICVPQLPDAVAVGEPREFDSRSDLAVVTPVLQVALRRLLIEEWGFQLLRNAPLDFVSRRNGKDLLEAATGGQGVEGLHVFPRYRLEARQKGPGGTPGIVVGLRTRYEIDLPVSELLSRGIDVVGRYVMMTDADFSLLPGMDPRAARHLVGRVEEVSGHRLRLSDSAGPTEVSSTECWLEPRQEVLRDILAVAAGPGHRRIEDRLAEEQYRLCGAEGRFARIEEIAGGLLNRNPLTIAEGVQVAIGKPAGSAGRVSSSRLEQPTFVFDISGNKTHRWAKSGVQKYGPFDSEGFTPKTPQIAVITPQQHKGTAEQFIHGFLHGLPGTSYDQGFLRKYRLVDAKIHLTTFDGDARDAPAYRRACLEAAAGSSPDLAFVIVSEEQSHLTGDASPYYVSKSTLMSQGVPVQEIRIETIKTADLPSTCETIALASYAKLGGIPFVIGTVGRALAHELVIGIGNSEIRTSRHGNAQRFVGITTVFSSDGNYILSNASHQVEYDQYPQELLRTLRTCITDVKARNGWQPDDTIRLIFHVFKALKDSEAKAVKALVEELAADYAGVDFAFLHVGDKHDWMMFDLASNGIQRRQRTVGKSVPGRGHAVQISGSEMLITVTEAEDMKQPMQGAPGPLKIQLHRESTFTDLHYLAGQVFRFTALSWRRYYPDHQPVTIRYSEMIAGLLGQLREVTNWNPDMIFTTRLRHSRWFL